ncbi:IS5/IS1182 family transposase, partial [Streptomyces olivaceus]
WGPHRGAVPSPPFSTGLNRSHTKIRALAERAVATLKSWRLLHKLRSSTTRITSLVQALLTLHLTSSER